MESLKQWKPETFDIASFKWHLSERKNKELLGNGSDLGSCYYTFNELGFRGENEAEEAYVVKNTGEYKLEEGKVVVKVDPKYYRPTEVDLLIGDPTKAMTQLGWKPKYDLAALVKEMVASDLEIFKKELLLKENGYTTSKESE